MQQYFNQVHSADFLATSTTNPASIKSRWLPVGGMHWALLPPAAILSPGFGLVEPRGGPLGSPPAGTPRIST
jgi:hypothetical protein